MPSSSARPYVPVAVEAPEATYMSIGDVLLRNRFLVFGLPLLLAAIVVAYSLLRPRQHVAESQFLPQAPQQNNARLAGLATQFGIQLGGGSDAESPEFYAALLNSHAILSEAVLTSYRAPLRGSDESEVFEGTLIDLYEIDEGEPTERARLAAEELRDVLSVDPNTRTGIVTVRVSARSPELATQINTRLLELVNAFNLDKRQSRAAAERRFVEERLEGVRAQLEQAEADVTAFMESNRSYGDSPQLSAESNRLQRRVDLQQQVYTSLSESYEEARIDEVRNTPVLTVLQEPYAQPGRRGLLFRGLMALVLGALIGMGIAFTRALKTGPDTVASTPGTA